MAVAETRDVEGLDAKRIAGGDNALAGRKNEGEHTVDLADPFRRARAEEMQDRLAVAGGRERTWPDDGANVLVIVDLAVDDQHVVALMNRLRAILRSDDGQSAMRHDNRAARQPRHRHRIRAAMGQAFDHASRQRLVADVPQADEPAHEILFLSPAFVAPDPVAHIRTTRA